ncbi:MAG: hypothetical protein DI637_03165 [Citromicrobium sp.]|nr:MAG: hypothetical protein DI637_03165 [Citromicrobium sp.]
MIRISLLLPLVALATACSRTDDAALLCTLDENGRIITESGRYTAACVEPTAIPRGATQEPSGRLTILEAPLPAPFTGLDKKWPPDPVEAEPQIARPAMPTELSYYIRAFPQEKTPAGDVLSISTEHVIVLRDGCFFADLKGNDDPLVMFPFGAALTVDNQGYLAFGSRYEPNRMGTVRVGLRAETGMVSQLFDPSHEVVQLCGKHKMIAFTMVSDPFSSPERFNPGLRRYGERSGATDAQVLQRANACAMKRAQRDADRRLRDPDLDPIDCNRFWGF